MGGRSLLALYLLVILESWRMTLACLPREYENNNICCPMCDKGFFVKSHCQSASTSSVCVICADFTYMDHPNGLAECRRCTECDLGADLIVKKKCTTTSDTVCECKAGHFCQDEGCDLCQEHIQCKPGQYVKTPGTPLTNTVCEECPSRHFSNETNANDCHPWKECSALNLVLYKEGNTTTDSRCNEKRGHYGLAFLVASVGVPILLVIRLVRESYLMRGATLAVPDPEKYFTYPLSEQEEGQTVASANTQIIET